MIVSREGEKGTGFLADLASSMEFGDSPPTTGVVVGEEADVAAPHRARRSTPIQVFVVTERVECSQNELRAFVESSTKQA